MQNTPTDNAKNSKNKEAPARSTIFHVDSVGVSPIDGKTYAIGVAHDADTGEPEPMAVSLLDLKGYKEFYSSIYAGESEEYISNQAENEFHNTQENSTFRDNSLKGVLRVTIEHGVGHAARRDEPLKISNVREIDKTLFEDISGRFVIALDNLKVTHEQDMGAGNKMRVATATRAQAMNPNSDTIKHGVGKALGYVVYTPPSESPDGKEKTYFKTYEDSAMFRFSQLADNDGKQKATRLMDKGLSNTMKAYKFPTAERNGHLEVSIFYNDENGRKNMNSFSVQPYLNLSEKYDESLDNYMPRISGESFMQQVVEGREYHTRQYNAYKAGKTAKKPDIDTVAKHDFMRFMNKAREDYEGAMKGNYISVLTDEDRATSPAAVALKKMQDSIIKDPNSAYVSMMSSTMHMLQKNTKNRVAAVKNRELYELRADEDPEAAKKDLVHKREIKPVKSLRSAIKSKVQKDASGKMAINNVISPMMFSMIQVDSNVTIVGLRGESAYIPAPHFDKKYLPSSTTFYSNVAIPDGKAESAFVSFNTEDNSPDNPLENETLRAITSNLKESLALHPRTNDLIESQYKELNGAIPIPPVKEPYFFNDAVKRVDLNEKARTGSKIDYITENQKRRVVSILGNYNYHVNKGTPEEKQNDKIFNTPYKKGRLQDFFNEINHKHPNFFMGYKKAQEHGYDVYGGQNVMRDLLDYPATNTNEKHMNIYKRYGDVIGAVLEPGISDDKLKQYPRELSHEEIKQTNIHNAIPTSADSQTAKISKLYPNANELENKATIDDLNDMLRQVRNENVSIPLENNEENQQKIEQANPRRLSQ